MLIHPPDLSQWGTFEMLPRGPFVAGSRTSIRFRYTTGQEGLRKGSRLRVGIPNTGWEEPVVPQQRYWDELVSGRNRRLAPFHPTNTTATVRSAGEPGHTLEVMERMLLPDEDPALAYWRWWVTFILEGADLAPGDQVEILYGDTRFGSEGIRVQTFVESGINVGAYLDPHGRGEFFALADTPIFIDVVSGQASRANIVSPSILSDPDYEARISLTDPCQCIPQGDNRRTLVVGGTHVECRPGKSSRVGLQKIGSAPFRSEVTAEDGCIWGRSNPSIDAAPDGSLLFWGDLHAQSEHHVMHSQGKNFRQSGWSKGISCGTLDECYAYGKEIALLDFVAITDQGACLTDRWPYCQEKVREYHRPGEFVVFKGYEAGSPLGHRNVIYLSDEIDSPLDADILGTFHPSAVFKLYHGRDDVLIIPHHVKTWTDWTFHDPVLEPVMEVYSCWGQSESPGTDLWNKGQTPGAGAWEAFRKGYKLGMIASSDNHVGMPGRSYPGDRQIHTPFKGGLCAIWAEDLSRDSLFQAIRKRRCYGTTGDRIILRFFMNGQPMGSILPPQEGEIPLAIEVYGTEAVDRVELVHDLQILRVLRSERDEATLSYRSAIPAGLAGCFYLRVFQKNNERAWSSPIWVA